MWLTNPVNPGDVVENVAFTAYAARQEQLDAVVDAVVEQVQNEVLFGNMSFNFNLGDDYTQDEIDYIQRKVQERCQ